MAYDSENLKSKRAGMTRETSDVENTPAGLWRHPATGAEAVTLFDPLYGDTQSQAFARLGFERVGDAPKGYVKTLATPSLQYEADKSKFTDNTDQVKGILARLNAAEAEVARLKNAEESGNPVPGTEPVPGAEETKQEAQNKVAERAEADPLGVGPAPKAEEPQKALDKMNRLELEAKAKELGVEPAEHDTNKKLREAIEAKSKEGNV